MRPPEAPLSLSLSLSAGRRKEKPLCRQPLHRRLLPITENCQVGDNIVILRRPYLDDVCSRKVIDEQCSYQTEEILSKSRKF